MITNFNIYPTRGFLNTDFKIKSNIPNTVVVYNNENICFELCLNTNETKTLPRFNSPGCYFVESKVDGLRQAIRVEDAIRLGTSTLKRAYVFDDFPFIIFVMKDRIHFYDPLIESYVYTENFLCPDKIFQVGFDNVLLFVTEHEEGVSISAFDTESFTLSDDYECEKILAYSSNHNTLYALKNRELCVVESNGLSEIAKYVFWGDLWFNNDKTLIYGIGGEDIFCINIDSRKERKLALKNVLTITHNGYLIQKAFKYGYSFVCLDPESDIKGTFSYIPLYNEISYEGHKITSPFPPFQFKYCYDGYINAEKNDIVNAFKDRIFYNSPAYLFFDIRGVECSAIIDFYPSKEGVYVIENVVSNIYNGVSYDKQKEQLIYKPNNIRQINLLWIEDGKCEIKYSTISDNITAVKVNGLKASMVHHPDKSFLIEKGKIAESFPDVNEAARQISDEQIVPEKNTVIIDGKPILESQIICRGKNKLLSRIGNVYKYYVCNNNGEWEFKKIIDLSEEKHTRAAMSSDGKYLVFSKGGNKYALYDIEKQKEETILTGNFVDADKTGHFIFSDQKRQLRIYDPKTLNWVKDIPYYYTFVSPDGKLYAKTSMISKYVTKWDMKEISKEDYFAYSSKYNFPTDRFFPADEYRLRRQKLISEKHEYFESFFKKENEKEWVFSRFEFTESFIDRKQYVIVGIVGTDTVLEIGLDTHLDYLNYVSFSYDNTYVGIVGKPMDNGYLKLVKITFDEDKEILKIDKNICDMQIARKATWTCSFTKFGLFGTYDSMPNLYLIETDAFSILNKEGNNNFNVLKDNFCIPNRSLMCFSESGKYMALSVQGYEPLSLGGKGHVPSNKMFICRTDTHEEIEEWSYQGEGISKLLPDDSYSKNLIQAGFSFDDKKIMTVTGDGVVIVRNLHLEIEEDYMEDYMPYDFDTDDKTRFVNCLRITADGIVEDFLPISCSDDEMWDPLDDVIYSADGKTLKDCKNIKIRKYEVLKGTETIMNKAFHGIFMPAEGEFCNLEEITLPSSIKTLDPEVFNQCPYLRIIYVPLGQLQRFISMLPQYKEIIYEKE